MEAAHFKRIRCLLGFSQRQLARALGVGKGSVSRWEAGALPVPRQTALALMALRSPELDNALAEVRWSSAWRPGCLRPRAKTKSTA